MPLGWPVRALSLLLAIGDAARSCDLCAVSGAAEAEKAAQREAAWGLSAPLSGGSAAGGNSGSFVGGAGDSARNGAGSDHGEEFPAPPSEERPRSRFLLEANVGLIEQYTSSESARSGSRGIADPDGQFLHATSTQALVGLHYDRVGLRAYLPYEYRQYRRAIPLGVETGWLYGPGDATVEATLLAIRHVAHGSVVLVTGIMGLKLPTGDSSILEQEEDLSQGQTTSGGHVHGSTGVTSAASVNLVHPHDLALGTGSYDGVFGVSTYLRAGRFYATARVIYDLRSEGTGGYRCADQWSWGGGPGFYLVSEQRGTVGLLANVTGESRGLDQHRGHQVDDSGITEVFIGPELTAAWAGLSGEVGADLPVLQRVNGEQLTADYRLHAGVNIGF